MIRVIPGLRAAGLVAVLVGVVVGLAACGGPSAESPLAVEIGLRRDQVASALREQDYCAGANPPTEREIFPRCTHPGADWGDSWVEAEYAEGRVVRLRRWERWSDDARAVERWNQLVAARRERGGDLTTARAQLAGQQELPAQTRSWMAFWAGDRTLVGVYLLRPSPPANAAILEEIVPVRAPPPDSEGKRPGCPDCAPVTD
jgi:hypothetical protein